MSGRDLTGRHIETEPKSKNTSNSVSCATSILLTLGTLCVSATTLNRVGWVRNTSELLPLGYSGRASRRGFSSNYAREEKGMVVVALMHDTCTREAFDRWVLVREGIATRIELPVSDLAEQQQRLPCLVPNPACPPASLLYLRSRARGRRGP